MNTALTIIAASGPAPQKAADSKNVPINPQGDANAGGSAAANGMFAILMSQLLGMAPQAASPIMQSGVPAAGPKGETVLPKPGSVPVAAPSDMAPAQPAQAAQPTEPSAPGAASQAQPAAAVRKPEREAGEEQKELEDLLSLLKINGEQAGVQGSKEKKSDTANKTAINETSEPALALIDEKHEKTDRVSPPAVRAKAAEDLAMELFVKPGSTETTEVNGAVTGQRNALTAAPQPDGLAAVQQSGDHARVAGNREVPTVGATQHAPVRAADPAAPFEQAVTIIRDGNRLAVRLEPDGLGKLDMDLRLNKGVVTAQIQVADDATKTLFERNAQQIVDALVREGISVGGFTVSLKDGNAWQGYAENEHNPGEARRAEAGKQVSAAAAAPYLGRVSLFA